MPIDTPVSDFAQRFGCDRELIEDTLRRVQAGEMSPAVATKRLLSGPLSPPLNRAKQSVGSVETIASLIARLGIPPSDIIDVWCQQMRFAAADHSLTMGEPIPTIDLTQWGINASGQLHWNGRIVTAPPESADPTTIDAVSAEHIQQFRDSLVSTRAGSLPLVATDTSLPDGSPRSDHPADVASQSHQRTSADNRFKGKRSPVARLVVSGLVVLCLAAIARILMSASHHEGRANKDSIAQSNSPTSSVSPLDSGVTSAESPEMINADPSPSARLSAASLETFDDASADDSIGDAVVASEQIADDLLSLEALMSAAPGFRERDSAESPTQATTIESMGDADTRVTVETIDPLAEDDGPGPEESPQATRTSEVTAIKLPSTDEIDVATELSTSPLRSIRLEFPFEVPLGLRDVDTGREIVDVRSDVAVATIKVGPDGMQHRWTPLAGKTASSSSLIHGRLKTDSGDLVYLRPTIEADFWSMDLERADVRPTWELLGPMPPRVTRLSIEFQLPDDVEQGWIEPIDSTSPRRSRGLAVLTPSDSELISLGVRFDIRGGRQLSCRVRYAARLDPAAAWQVVSRPMLERLANQLASQSEVVSQQITQMSAMYSNADRGGRRVLAPRRDAIEQRAEMVRELSDRVAKLQSLASKLEAGAKLKLHLWVEWPDGSQTLLETKE